MVNEGGKYIPGVCNIGDAEIRKRTRFGWAGLLAYILLGALLLLIDSDRTVRVVLFFPAFAASLGFLQGYMHFCAYFGLSALFNFGEAGSSPEEIWEEELRAADRKRAWQIIGYSAIIAVAMTAPVIILPV
jgi:hypothetical protein